MKRIFFESVSGNEYANFLRKMLGICTTASLTVQDQFTKTTLLQKFLSEADPHIIEIKRVGNWPGTGYIKDRPIADLYIFNYQEEFIQLLLKFANNIDKWQTPNLPEDLATYRKNGDPFLISVTHEKYFSIQQMKMRFHNMLRYSSLYLNYD